MGMEGISEIKKKISESQKEENDTISELEKLRYSSKKIESDSKIIKPELKIGSFNPLLKNNEKLNDPLLSDLKKIQKGRKLVEGMERKQIHIQSQKLRDFKGLESSEKLKADNPLKTKSIQSNEDVIKAVLERLKIQEQKFNLIEENEIRSLLVEIRNAISLCNQIGSTQLLSDLSMYKDTLEGILYRLQNKSQTYRLRNFNTKLG
jgi:hypothetical protein